MQEITLDHAIEVLNDLLNHDPRAIEALVENRIPCNSALAGHPTCQIMPNNMVGMLGVLNALFGVDERNWGFLCGVYDDDGRLVAFARTPTGA